MVGYEVGVAGGRGVAAAREGDKTCLGVVLAVALEHLAILAVHLQAELLVDVLPLLQQLPLRLLARPAETPLVGHPRRVESVVAAAVDTQALGLERLLQRVAHRQHQ